MFARDIRPRCRTPPIDSRRRGVVADSIAVDMATLLGCQSKNLSSVLTSFRLIWPMHRHSSTTSECLVKCLCFATGKWDGFRRRLEPNISHRHFSNIGFGSDCGAVNRCCHRCRRHRRRHCSDYCNDKWFWAMLWSISRDTNSFRRPYSDNDNHLVAIASPLDSSSVPKIKAEKRRERERKTISFYVRRDSPCAIWLLAGRAASAHVVQIRTKLKNIVCQHVCHVCMFRRHLQILSEICLH